MKQPVDFPLPIFVAVYGSLKKGFGNHRLLSDSTLIGRGSTDTTYDMISLGGFPGLVEGNNHIQVEVYEVTEDKLLHSLDRLEGYPSFYNRELIDISLDNGSKCTAWIYHLKNKQGYTGGRYTSVNSFDIKSRQVWVNPNYSIN